MRRVIAVAVAGLSLAGCSSASWDMFKSTPAPIQVQLESDPPGADAKTSLGPGCKTPCSVSVPPPDSGGFTVTYTLDKFQPATVPVQVTLNSGTFNTSPPVVDPNPVVAQLQAAPSPRAKRMRPRKPRAPKAAVAPAGDAAFPAPNAAPR